MKKVVKIGIPLLLLLIIAVVLLAPIGPLPGFFIRGTETSPPKDWPNTNDIHEIRLEVPGTLPRVVIIWVIGYESELYVTGRSTSGWVRMLGTGGPVKMRLGDNTYPLRASAVDNDVQPILKAYMDKYRPDYPDIVSSFPSADNAGKDFVVFKLERP